MAAPFDTFGMLTFFRNALILCSLLALSSCAAPPRQQLQEARLALAHASHSGAEKLAPEEFQAAQATLREAEELLLQKRYEEASDILPLATEKARFAARKAAQEQRQAKEESTTPEKEQRSEPVAKPTKAPPKPKPAPPPEPPPATAEVPEPSPPRPESYTVSGSEDLQSIAAREEIYSDPLLWPLIYQANRDQIKDPKIVYPGQVLNIPRGVSPEEIEEARSRARRSEVFSTLPSNQ